MEIALSQVLRAARQRRAAVTAEVAGYLLLLIARSLASRPQRLAADSILLSAEGEVGVVGGPPASAGACESDLRGLLVTLLGLSQSAPPALRAAAERAAAGDLQALVAELLAALIPINHAAAGRALARVYRETSRAESAAREPASETGWPLPSGAPVPVAPVSTAPASTAPASTAPASTAPASTAPASTAPASTAPASASSPPPRSSLVSLISEALANAPLSTPLPSAATPVVLASETAELEIDVEFVDNEETLANGARGRPEPDGTDLDLLLAQALPETPASSVPPISRLRVSRADEDLPLSGLLEYSESAVRSDVRELIEGFLAHTRSDERMTEDLRRMIGLAPRTRSPLQDSAAS